MQIIRSIQNRIYEVRGERVMRDFDLAAIYEVEKRALNQSVKRNSKRFPEDFMFQLSSIEWKEIQPQVFAATNGTSNLKSQIVMSSWGGNRHLPYAFTEQGIAMLSGILNSDKAIAMNIAIMHAFVEIRKLTLQQIDFVQQLQLIKDKLGQHDVQLSEIYDAMENLLDDKAAQRKWENRERIGFKK